MKYLTHSLSIGCLLIASGAYGQKPDQAGRTAFVPIPREIALPVIVFQPDSPLQFEKVQRLMNVDGGGAHLYQLRNRSTKSIRRFTVSYTFGIGTGGSWEWGSASGELIMPGQLAPSPVGDPGDRVISLTDELREKLGLRGPMKTVVFYMVERVEFADGSTYIDEPVTLALKAYLDDIDDKVHRSKQTLQEKRSSAIQAYKP